MPNPGRNFKRGGGKHHVKRGDTPIIRTSPYGMEIITKEGSPAGPGRHIQHGNVETPGKKRQKRRPGFRRRAAASTNGMYGMAAGRPRRSRRRRPRRLRRP